MSVRFDEKNKVIVRNESVSYPTNVNLYQLMFEFDGTGVSQDGKPMYRPSVEPGSVWMYDPDTKSPLTMAYCQKRSVAMAKGFKKRGFAPNDALCILAPNSVDYPLAIFAAFRLDGVVTCANPAYSAAELSHQFKIVSTTYNVKTILIDPTYIEAALEAVQSNTMDPSRIILTREASADLPLVVQFAAQAFPTIEDIIHEGLEESLPKLSSLAPGEAFSKVAFLNFSSGTTGLPKAVVISHGNVVANIFQIGHDIALKNIVPYNPADPGAFHDRALAVLPFFHIYGLVCSIFFSMFYNMPMIPVAQFSLQKYLDLLRDLKATFLWLVPPIALLLAKHPLVKTYDLSSVRYAVSGAAPLSQDVISVFNKSLPHIKLGQGYGMTESAVVVSFQDFSLPQMKHLGSAGRILPNAECRIVSLENEPLKLGSVGELWVRSPSITLGYLANKEATEDTYTSDGFLKTGDECTINDEGYLFILDRIKELIKVKGNQVAPAELEGLINGLPFVADVAVCGIPDDFNGEVPLASIALTDAAKSLDKSVLEHEIRELVAKNKIKYKHLGYVQFVESIPRNASGKILRRAIKADFLERNKPQTPRL